MLSSFDILAPGLPVVFCGINPSPKAAATGHNFGSPSNRFWRTLHLAGFTPTVIQAEDDRSILQYGCGITAAFERATRRASDLNGEEMRRAAGQFERKIVHYRPAMLAFLGRPAFAAITGSNAFDWGAQPAPFAGACVWVLPNPSGLNRSYSLDRLVAAYGALRRSVEVELRIWSAR